MAYLFLDDSKHHGYGLSVAAFVICDADPSSQVDDLFRSHGFDPAVFEFKSSANMAGNDDLQNLRAALKWYIASKCKIALCVVGNDEKRIGPAAIELLEAALKHPNLCGSEHQVFFDEGLFSSVDAAQTVAESIGEFPGCTFHFEQDSRKVAGIQLADIVAHTCSIMLLEALGHIDKKIIVNSPGDTAYHGLEIELGFEMWADIRYAFLSQNKKEEDELLGPALVDVFPWGLFIEDSASDEVRAAAMRRFGENYLGCIH